MVHESEVTLKTVKKELRVNSALGYRKYIHSFPPGEHFERVDVFVAPETPISPAKPTDLEDFKEGLMFGFNPKYSRAFYITQEGNLVLGRLEFEETLPGRKLVREHFEIADQ